MSQDELMREDRISRYNAAQADVLNGTPVDEAIALHGMTEEEDIEDLRYYTALISVKERGMPAEEAIALRGVTKRRDIASLRYHSAMGDVLNGMPADKAIALHGVTHEDYIQSLRKRSSEV